MNTIQYRVKAVDSNGAESGYKTSAAQTVNHNKPPTISGADGSLGVKAAPFSFSYTVADPDGDTISVVEVVDGQTIKTYNPVPGQAQSMEVDGDTWVKLTNGNHTLTVKATDTSNATVTRTMSFVKNVTACGFSLKQSDVVDFGQTQPTRMTIEVIREVAAGAALTVEVCNNGFDTSPTWEAATTEVLGGLAHVFTNTTKTAGKWGVSVRVNIDRGGAIGNCRIYGVGGYIE